MTPSTASTNPLHGVISDKTPIKLPAAVWVVFIASVFGAGVGFGVMQQQISESKREMDQQKHRIEKLESDNSLLHRIDERTAEMKRQLDRITK